MYNIDIIRNAMNSRKSISATYDNLFRKLSPYKLGYKKTKLHCLLYQYAGVSKHGPIIPGSSSNWRCMEVIKLRNLAILDEPLQRPRVWPIHPQSCIDTLVKEIKY